MWQMNEFKKENCASIVKIFTNKKPEEERRKYKLKDFRLNLRNFCCC